MCRLRKHDKRKREEFHRQKSAQRNALEMAVCNSSNTTQCLSRQQNEKDGLRQGKGANSNAGPFIVVCKYVLLHECAFEKRKVRAGVSLFIQEHLFFSSLDSAGSG